jgi:hypothetical protein
MTLRRYQHRVNSVAELERLPEDLGVELDLRSDGDRVIVTHDPFTDGPIIEEYLARVGRRPCIFNVKCEGIEERVRAVARHYAISDFFFLDLSVPAAVKLAGLGEGRFAVRYSEYEPIEGVLAWRGRASWVWVDCFTTFPAGSAAWERLAEAFRICLVSPELQGHDPAASGVMRRALAGLRYDAVCTKRPDLW